MQHGKWLPVKVELMSFHDSHKGQQFLGSSGCGGIQAFLACWPNVQYELVVLLPSPPFPFSSKERRTFPYCFFSASLRHFLTLRKRCYRRNERCY